MGKVLLVDNDNGKTIANLFAQNSYGRGIRQTDYNAMKECFKMLRDSVLDGRHAGKSIALPHGIGCGLAGGDWGMVESIIDETLSECDVSIYKL